MENQTIKQLNELKELFEKNILTREEMESEKAKILASSTNRDDNKITKNDSSAKEDSPSSIKFFAFLGIVIAGIVIICLLTFSGKKSPSSDYESSSNPYYQQPDYKGYDNGDTEDVLDDDYNSSDYSDEEEDYLDY